MNIELYPLEKAVFDGVSIYLGMEQAAVEKAIGAGQLTGKRSYYWNHEMAIDYCDGKVSFIEFLCGADGTLKPAIYGVSVFDIRADHLVEILKNQNGGEICDGEKGYSYQFPNIGIGVYREAVPEEVTELIREAAAFGHPMDDEEIENEMKKASYFAAIGMGAADYYQR